MGNKRLVTLLSTAVFTAATALSVPTTASMAAPAKAAAKETYTNNVYIVRLAGDPVVAYKGGIRGLPATRPAKGQKINPRALEVANYKSHLVARHDAVLARVGGGKKLYSYGYVFNGFAAELTAAQAEKLARLPGVLAVSRDELRTLNTSSTPDFLGLSGDGAVWDSQAKGQNVVIGIVDGGIWPEHPSFSDQTPSKGKNKGETGFYNQPVQGWSGTCVEGEDFTANLCNKKLIGARYYNAGWGGDAGIDAQLPWEYNSPRDFGGHGTHTASTAGGNQNVNVPATEAASVFGNISGIAPRARIAAYKVCWETGAGGSCFTTDSVAAIDQAVADGVDVINFSISGSRTNFRDPVEIAFLFAADAGVFVAASAGNSGPATSTVAHPGPWLTTVAAGTHNRNGAGSVTLGNGVTYQGASVAAAVGTAPFVDATAAGRAGANPAEVALCFPGTLEPAVVSGKIVYCDRGVNARTEKSRAVQMAGGVGMVMANTSASSLNADLHFVPTVHISHLDRAAVKAYAATSGATATINQSTVVYNEPAPFTAAFSSRGPLIAGGGDLLKPDLIAPGQDVLAAVAPPGNNGRLFDVYSGTSMSSPHVAGLAALLKEKHPSWSPMMIKSALMTTGTDVLDGGTPAPNTNPVLIFRQGAGHVQPSAALDPGLVYDSGLNDWLAFICAKQPQGLEAQCNALWSMGYSRDASDFNSPSIAIGDLAGTQTVTRRVTNVSGMPLTMEASVSGVAGFAVTVSPSTLTLAPGETKEFTVGFVNATAPLGTYVGGQLTWTGGGYTVRSPIVVRPIAPVMLVAPATVSSSGSAISYPVTFGYTGTFTAAPRGLIPATTTVDSVEDDPTDGACSLAAQNARLIPVTIPAGTTYARFSLFDADVSPGADIDLCVANSTGSIVGSSTGGTSAEEINLPNPASGDYTVVVQGWGVNVSSPFKLHTWLLGSAAAGNMTVSAPAAAAIGAPGTISLSFSGLTGGTRYLGSVAYSGTTGLPGPTLVRVDTP